MESNYNNDRQDVAKCPSCSKGHNLEKCPPFKSKDESLFKVKAFVSDVLRKVTGRLVVAQKCEGRIT